MIILAFLASILITSVSCTPWNPNCKVADPTDDESCLECVPGYYRKWWTLDKKFMCWPCVGGCSECTSSSNCTVCAADFTMSETACYKNCDATTECSSYYSYSRNSPAICTPSLTVPTQKVCMTCSMDEQCQTVFGRSDFKCLSG